jgi:hypothetical protein
MKRFRFFAVAALLISVQLMSVSCRHAGFGEKYLTYVNKSDTNQYVELEAAQPSMRSWWHNLPIEPQREGNYVRVNGKQRTGGFYRLEGDAYVLGSPDGQTNSRFSIQPDLNLKDEKGEMWHRPIPHVLDKKALVSIKP